MADFGGYEPVREIHRSGLGAISTARPAGSRKTPAFAIRTYRPFTPISSKEQARLELQSFIERARTQKMVADTGAPHWAKIHACGAEEDSGYYVCDLYERSAQKLILGQVKLTGAALHAIVESVVKGLIELKRACKRPHGNLKPSNVLISGKGDISSSEIALADPLAPDQVDPAKGDTVDFQPLGELIYQLVFHRPFPSMGWPVPPSEEWSRLGKNGEDWRNFCNRLLTPDQAPGWLTLEEIADDVAKLREATGGLLIGKLLAAAGVAALVVVAAVYLYITRVHPPHEQWRELCDWGRYIVCNDDARKEWEQDERLKSAILDPVEGAKSNGIEIDARRIAGRPKESFEILRERPPRGRHAVQETRKALEVADRIAGAVRALPKKPKWPALADRLTLVKYSGATLTRRLEKQTQPKDFGEPRSAVGAITTILGQKEQVDWCIEGLSPIENVGCREFKVVLTRCARPETRRATSLKGMKKKIGRMRDDKAVTECVHKLKDLCKTTNDSADKKLGEEYRRCAAKELGAAKNFVVLKAKILELRPPFNDVVTWLKEIEETDVGSLGDELRQNSLSHLKSFLYQAKNFGEFGSLAVISKHWKDVGDYCKVPENNVPECRKLVRDVIKTAADLESLKYGLADIARGLIVPIPPELDEVIKLAADPVIITKIRKLVRAELKQDRHPEPERVKAIALKWQGVVGYHVSIGKTWETLATELRTCARKEAEGAQDLNTLQSRARVAAKTAEEIVNLAEANKQLIASADTEFRPKLGKCRDWEMKNAESLSSLKKRVEEANSRTAEIVTLWPRAQSYRGRIDRLKDGSKFLPAFGDYVEDECESANDLKQLEAGLKQVNGLAEKLVGFLEGDWRSDEKFARALFLADPIDEEPEETPAKEGFESWLEAAESYYWMGDDPREIWTRGDKAVASLIEEYKSLPKRDAAKLQVFEERLGAVSEALKKVPDTENTPPIEKNRELIWAGRKGLTAEIDQLKKEVEIVTVPPSRLVKEFRDEVRRAVGIPQAFKNDPWPKVTQSVDHDLNAYVVSYWQLQDLIPELRRQLTALDKEFQSPETAKLKTLARSKRDEALSRTIKQIPWAKVDGLEREYPDLTGEDFVRKKDAQRADLRKWGEALAVLSTGFQAIDTRMNESWHEKNLPESISEPYAKLKKSAVFREPGVAPVFEPTTSRVERLLNIEKLTEKNKNELIALAQSDKPEVAASAWWQLGRIENWPKGLGELKREADMRKKLAEKKFPADNLAAQGPPRWEKCLLSLTDCADIEEAAKLREEFGVSAENVAPPARYNILLWDFLKRLRGFQQELKKTGGAKEQEALLKDFTPQITRFEEAVGRLPNETRSKKPFELFRTSLADVKNPGKVVDLREEGPGAAGWGLVKEQNGDRLKYFWPNVSGRKPRHELVFVRVKPKDTSRDPFYLCATEIPAGLFIDIANENEKIRERLWREQRFDTRGGPRSWGWRRGKAKNPGRWLRADPRWTGVRGKDEKVDPGKPSDGNPMQYVSLEAAKGFCEAIKCRLPTHEEWRAAFNETAHEGKRNLRDKRWKDYLDTIRGMELKRPPYPYPDNDIFSAGEFPKGPDAKVVSQKDDGVLRFSKVDSGEGPIYHLVGNVAELVKRADRFAVVGGSASSPPQMWDGHARPFDKAYDVLPNKDNKGWADVGFRPAFRAGGKSVAARVSTLLQNKCDYYLVPAGD